MMTEIFFCENWLIWLYEKACFTPIAPRFETICTWFGFLESQKKKKKKMNGIPLISGNLCSTEVSYFIDEKYICWKNRNSWNWHRKVEKGKVLRSLIKSTFTLTAVIADCRH